MSLRFLAIAVTTFLLTGPALAGGRVDWSEYIDRNPSKPIAVAPAVAREEAPSRADKKASRAKKKVAKSKAVKARKKKKARR